MTRMIRLVSASVSFGTDRPSMRGSGGKNHCFKDRQKACGLFSIFPPRFV